MPIDFRVLVLDSRSYARSGGRPRLRLVGANIPVKEALGEDRHVRLRRAEQRHSHYQGVAFGGRCGYLRGARVARLGGRAVRRPCASERVAALLEGPAPCPRPGAACRTAHGRRLVATGLQGHLRTLPDGVGRGGLDRHRRRIQGGPRGGSDRGRSTVAYRADGRLFLWPPLATAPPHASTVPPWREAPVVDREAFGRSRGR